MRWFWKTVPSRATVEDIFTPGGEPSVTYVGRERLGLEKSVSSALGRRHTFILVSGPTKCGKSVLCRRLLRGQPNVTINGGQVTGIEDFWNQIAHQQGLARSTSVTRTNGSTGTLTREGSVGFWGWLTARLSKSEATTSQRAIATNYTNVLSIDAIGVLRQSNTVLLLEDFHYIPPDVQRSIIRALKPAVFDGLRAIIVAVPHRQFDAVNIEHELEGRIDYVEIPSWSLDDLLEIPEKGFSALGLEVPSGSRLTFESR